jgi:hypothetical protein
VFLWNLVDLERMKWEGAEALTPRQAHGRVRLQVRRPGCRHAGVQQLQRRRPARHRHAEGGRQGGRDQAMEKTLPMILQWDESFDIGSDT